MSGSGVLAAARSASRAFSGWALAALVAAAAVPAHASAQEGTSVATRRVVRLEVLGTPEEGAALRASLSELFGRIAVELEASPGGTESGEAPLAGTLLVAQVDLREPGTAIVRLARAGAAAGESRTVPQRESRALLLEEAALVLYTASESWFEEAPPPPPVAAPSTLTPETAAVLPAPAAPAPPLQVPHPGVDRVEGRASRAGTATPWSVEATMLAGFRAYASDARAVTGFGLGVRGHVGHGRWIPGAWLLGQFHFPFSATNGSVELSTSVWSVRCFPSLDLWRSNPMRLELGLGGGADIFVVTPLSGSPEPALGPHRQDVSAVLSALVAGSVALSPVSRFVVAATLDYDLQPRRYVVAQGGVSSVILEPWKVRPALSVGFHFEMAGGGTR